ncbi:hypothetical protein FIBSPDRAFT_891763 [Athelia psychrophila]|uniref:Uncharacterized protein n=1 Tax=Athelia psychrophila TaxID=1759441 RepID=A0A166JAQ3_9AGAM|nr:hypothetical protein FIBSPDRAFT_891763 [Fibularhizoctonia sp. CBS 109695]
MPIYSMVAEQFEMLNSLLMSDNPTKVPSNVSDSEQTEFQSSPWQWEHGEWSSDLGSDLDGILNGLSSPAMNVSTPCYADKGTQAPDTELQVYSVPERCDPSRKAIKEVRLSVPGGSELRLDSGVDQKCRHSFDVCESSTMNIWRVGWSRVMAKKMWARYSDTVDRAVSGGG